MKEKTLAHDSDSKSAKERVMDTVTDALSGTTDKAHEIVEGAGGIAAQNPLGIVGGAFALGLLTGLVLPVTDVERRRIGPLRDTFVDRAGDVAGDAVEHGKQVVQETAKAAMQTAVSSALEHGQDLLEEATHSPA